MSVASDKKLFFAGVRGVCLFTPMTTPPAILAPASTSTPVPIFALGSTSAVLSMDGGPPETISPQMSRHNESPRDGRRSEETHACLWRLAISLQTLPFREIKKSNMIT